MYVNLSSEKKLQYIKRKTKEKIWERIFFNIKSDKKIGKQKYIMI